MWKFLKRWLDAKLPKPKIEYPIIEGRWDDPNACNLCGKKELCMTEEHICPPDFTFVWCRDCEKDQDRCDAIILTAVKKYWEKYPRPKRV